MIPIDSSTRSRLVDRYGDEAGDAVWRALERLAAEAPGLLEAVGRAGELENLGRVLAVSDFAAGRLLAWPQRLAGIVAAGELARARRPGELAAMCERRCLGLDDEALTRALREFRQTEFVRILWRDLCGRADIRETLRELSEVAEAAVVRAIAAAGCSMTERFGRVTDEEGSPVELRALAMGKLGGGELNFSSDVDLILVYRTEADSDGPRTLAAQDYFTRQARRAIALLDAVTADGFAFRVDVRLRPFGDSGALVVSLDALESYLAQHGRDWERYAYVKARMLGADAGDDAAVFEAIRRPFVYRRYLDYGVFESLRDMKALIEAEVRRREMQQNIKLGPGGIREIEFIVQSLQLVRGGSEPTLQQRSIFAAFDALVATRQLSDADAAALDTSYSFLRQLENRLQGLRDQQLHELPGSGPDRRRLALAMHCDDWPQLDERIRRAREAVQRQFAATVFRTAQDEEADAPPRFWSGDAERVLAELRALTPNAEPALAGAIAEYHGSLEQRPLDDISRRRVHALMPRLLTDVVVADDPGAVLGRLTRVVDAIVRRSAYISLLIENPGARRRFVELAGASEYLSRELAEHPVLLDELLDHRLYEGYLADVDLTGELAARLARADPGDLEQQVEALARFRRVAVFRVAIADFTGALPLMKVSDQLTWIAETIIDAALAMAWREAVGRYGVPRCVVDGSEREAGFAIAAYGKLGGLELGYGSDLDVVFLHDSEGERRVTDGPREIDNDVFFTRLAGRLVHFLTVQTHAGRLYEVDMRLRPSGRSGLLVTSLAALERYQREDAWTWEHQALLRARSIVGAARVRDRFEAVRRRALTEYVRRDTLADEVARMRARMRDELSAAEPGQFDIKQDAGGLADIEFLVQYLVLRDAHRHASLIRFSDNMRQLDALRDEGLVAPETVARLQAVYLSYRSRINRRALEGLPAVVPATEFETERGAIVGFWRQYFGEPAPAA